MRTSFYDVLTSHAAIYPKMEACDYVKLAYQSEFGCGHLISDREAARKALAEEMERTPTDALEPLTVPIGGGFFRLNLAAAKRFLSPDEVFSMFEKSAMPCGTPEGFQHKISLMCRAAERKILPCDPVAIRSYVEGLGDGIPSHSARFRHLYGASYRLITSEYALLAPAICLIADALRKAERITVAIDGRAASGKSTAATILSSLFDATIIHADDYFLPANKKTAERLAVPGGNLDAERLLSEVLQHRNEDTLTHARYDCSTGVLLPPVVESRRTLLLVEGVYTMRSDLLPFYDIKFFFDIDSQTQLLRLRERDGERMLQRYTDEWLPLEEAYFRTCAPMLSADLSVRFS